MKRYSDDAYLEDTDEIPDGYSVKVPVVFMDAVQRQFVGHRPGFAELTADQQQQRQASRSRYLQDLTTAWSRPVNLSIMDKSKTTPDPVRLDAADAKALKDAAYLERSRYLENAWRRPPHRDAAEPDMSTPPEEMKRRTTEPDRNAAYEAYRTNLSNAWRSPGAAANAVEQLRRKVTNEDSR